MITESEFLMAFFGITLIIAIVISFRMDAKLHREVPQLKGYVAGYVCAIWPMVVLAAFLTIAILSGNLSDIIGVPDVLAAVVSLCIFSALGVGIIKRNRWAFLIYVILTFTPLAWIFLGVYLARRWEEMKTEFVIVPKVEVVGEEETWETLHRP